MNEQDKDILGSILNDKLEPLTLQDIEALDVAKDPMIKFIQQYRWSMMIDKASLPADNVDWFKELTYKINMCTKLIHDILKLEPLRLKAIKKIADELENK